MVVTLRGEHHARPLGSLIYYLLINGALRMANEADLLWQTYGALIKSVSTEFCALYKLYELRAANNRHVSRRSYYHVLHLKIAMNN